MADAQTLNREKVSFEFYGDSISLSKVGWQPIAFDNSTLTLAQIQEFYSKANNNHYLPLVNHLLYFKKKENLDDWIFYQLIRKTANQLCPKAENFELYTLYKWFLLSKCGYDAQLAICQNKLLFYVRTEDNIYDIPYYKSQGKQYVCLNYHDYGSKIDFANLNFFAVNIEITEAQKQFSYCVTNLPNFKKESYTEKDINFRYGNKNYAFRVLINPEISTIFANYPVVDYEQYFNIPMSKATYNSLIPELKKALAGMTEKKGIDYLMRFSRDVFAFKSDQEVYGKEKRLSAEQTLLSTQSDCDDRAAFFFNLVKEIYNLPMIVVSYPTHVTIAVQFDKFSGAPIVYQGKKYYICEPTPQADDLLVGHRDAKFKNVPYEISYSYNPVKIIR